MIGNREGETPPRWWLPSLSTFTRTSSYIHLEFNVACSHRRIGNRPERRRLSRSNHDALLQPRNTRDDKCCIFSGGILPTLLFGDHLESAYCRQNRHGSHACGTHFRAFLNQPNSECRPIIIIDDTHPQRGCQRSWTQSVVESYLEVSVA